MIMTTPLLSMQSVPPRREVALAGFIAFLVMPQAYPVGWNAPAVLTQYALLVVGEDHWHDGLFLSDGIRDLQFAGQFFSYQMGLRSLRKYTMRSRKSKIRCSVST